MAGRCPEAGCVPCFLKVLAQGWNLRVHEGADGGSPWLYGSPSVWPCLGGAARKGLPRGGWLALAGASSAATWGAALCRVRVCGDQVRGRNQGQPVVLRGATGLGRPARQDRRRQEGDGLVECAAGALVHGGLDAELRLRSLVGVATRQSLGPGVRVKECVCVCCYKPHDGGVRLKRHAWPKRWRLERCLWTPWPRDGQGRRRRLGHASYRVSTKVGVLGHQSSPSGLLTTGRLLQEGAGAGRVDAAASSGTALRTGLTSRSPTAPAVGCGGVGAGRARRRGAQRLGMPGCVAHGGVEVATSSGR